jgi:hypothetical protein
LLLHKCRFILSAVARPDLPLTPRPTMDEPEADYLRQQIRELRRSNTCWRAVALISLTTLALLLLGAGSTLLTGRIFMVQRMRLEARDRAAAAAARMQAERAMQAEREARMRAEDNAQKKEVEKEAEPAKR